MNTGNKFIDFKFHLSINEYIIYNLIALNSYIMNLIKKLIVSHTDKIILSKCFD